MKYIIILVIIGVVLWKGKPYLQGLVLKWKNKKEKKEKKEVEKIDDIFVYEPVASSRTFNFSIQIDEQGGGKVKISIAKEKDLQ